MSSELPHNPDNETLGFSEDDLDAFRPLKKPLSFLSYAAGTKDENLPKALSHLQIFN